MPEDRWDSHAACLTVAGRLNAEGHLYVFCPEGQDAWAFRIYLKPVGWELPPGVPECPMAGACLLVQSNTAFTNEVDARRAAKAEWQRITSP